MNFSTGFNADYAIALNPNSASGLGNFGGLFQLATGGGNSLTFVTSVNLSPLSNVSSATYTFGFNAADIGLAANSGQSFSFVGTYLNGNNSFRSNEAFGDGIVGANPGEPSTVTFTGARSFTLVPEPSTLVLALFGAMGLMGIRRRR